MGRTAYTENQCLHKGALYLLFTLLKRAGDRGSTVVKVLCFISEGQWFDPQSAVSSGRVRLICSERAVRKECCSAFRV